MVVGFLFFKKSYLKFFTKATVITFHLGSFTGNIFVVTAGNNDNLIMYSLCFVSSFLLYVN